MKDYSQKNCMSTDRVGKTKVAVSSHDSQVTIIHVIGLPITNIEAMLCSPQDTVCAPPSPSSSSPNCI